MKLIEYIKLGIGLYIGQEIGKEVKNLAADIYKLLKKRVETGRCD